MGDRGHNIHGPKRGGGCSAHFAGELGPCLTQCGLSRGLLPYQVASSSIQLFGHNRHESKTGGCATFTGEGSCDPIWHNVAWAEVYLRTKWHLDPSSRLATIDMGQKLGGAVPFFVGKLGPIRTQSRLGRGLPPYQVSSWSIQLFGHNRHGPKIGGCAPLREELGPHLTQCVLGRGLWAHASPQPEQHLDRFSCFCTAY